MSALLSDDVLEDLEAFAVELAAAAGRVALPLFRAGGAVEDKNAAEHAGRGFDPVTEADRGGEAAIRRAISARFPDHGVLGEEYGADRADADFVWVLDPIDGTRAFVAGVPLWTHLIALRHQGAPVVGVVAQSYLDETYVGSRRGARLIRGGASQELRVRPCPTLADAVLASTDPDGYFADDELAAWRRLRRGAKIVRLGGDAYFGALVAAGTVDLNVEAQLKPWDVEALVPLVQGAGGSVTDWRGKPLGNAGGRVLLAGDPRCIEAALAVLAKAT